MQAKQGVGVGPVTSGIVDLKLRVRIEIGEGRVDGVGGHDEVDRVVGAALCDAERQLIVGHGQVFVGHPGGDFAKLCDVGVDIARVLDDWGKAVEDGATGDFGQRLVCCG